MLGSLYLEAQREHFMKAMKGKPGCTGDPKLLEIPKPWMGYLPREAANREWNQPKTEKQEDGRRWEEPYVSGMRLQDLEFALPGFSLALVQNLLTMLLASSWEWQ